MSNKLISLLIVILLSANTYASSCYWLGGDVNSTGDWQDANNWEPNTVPDDGCDVIFDGKSTYDVNDGIAQDETGGKVYNSIYVRASYEGDIGDVNEHLHCAAGKIIWEGTGTGYITVSADDNTTDINIPMLILNNSSANLYLSSQINDTNYCNDFKTIILVKGTLDIGDNTAVENLNINSGLSSVAASSSSGSVSATVHTNCERYKADTYKMNIVMQNGSLTTDSAANTIQQFGGTLTYGSDLTSSPETGMDISALKLYLGTFYWHPDDVNDDATISDMYLYGGVFDASSTTNRDRAKKLGGGSEHDIYIFNMAKFKINNSMGNITVDPNSKLYNFGGELYLDNGTQIGVNY
jgi:hypothetical protein